MHILLLNQNSDEAAFHALALQMAGIDTTTVETPSTELANLATQPIDVVLISDRKQYFQSALDAFLKVLKAPVLLVTERLEEDDHIELLQQGIAVVLFRPCSARLLRSQAMALARSTEKSLASASHLPRSGKVALEPRSRTVSIDQNPPVQLSGCEYRLLSTLIQHKGQTLTRVQLAAWVWGCEAEASPSIRKLVYRLRKKVEPQPAAPQYILTKEGMGYAFVGA